MFDRRKPVFAMIVLGFLVGVVAWYGLTNGRDVSCGPAEPGDSKVSAVAVPPGSQPPTPEQPSMDEPALPVGVSSPTTEGFWEPGSVVWRDSTHQQDLHMTDFEFVDIVDRYYDPPTGTWIEGVTHGSTSYSILRFGSAGADWFCFAGLAGNGDFVLERWKLKPKGGMVPPPPYPLLKIIKKIEVYRGQLADKVAGVGFDPERRFIIALLRDSAGTYLYRFDHQPSATPVLLYDESTLPELASMTTLDRYDHAVVGRVWTMQDNWIYSVQVVLIDSDNDGEFEGPPLIGNRTFFQAAGLNDPTQWDNLSYGQ